MLSPFSKSDDKNFYLLKEIQWNLPQFDHKFDIFADPPILSNNGLTIQNGQIATNKGTWDKSHGFEYINQFNRKWLSLVRDKMKEDATIWISGTMHNIFSVGQILTELGFKILNIITWEKTNPPPNFSCRYFTHSSEQIIWARKSEKVPHYFNYELMKTQRGRQERCLNFQPLHPGKNCGKHPTQNPFGFDKNYFSFNKPNA